MRAGIQAGLEPSGAVHLAQNFPDFVLHSRSNAHVVFPVIMEPVQGRGFGKRTHIDKVDAAAVGHILNQRRQGGRLGAAVSDHLSQAGLGTQRGRAGQQDLKGLWRDAIGHRLGGSDQPVQTQGYVGGGHMESLLEIVGTQH